jgi:predicted lipoprotein with Yx(FWY)xxD motif
MRRVTSRAVATVLIGAAGFAVAALAGLAIAKSFTLHVDKNASITNANSGNTKHGNLVVNSANAAVYYLSGDGPGRYKCTPAMCWSVWPPVAAPSGKLTAAPGISGKLGSVKRGTLNQLTLGGHPLYTFKGEPKGQSSYDGAQSFGGTWHVSLASSTKKGTQHVTTTVTQTDPNTTTSTSTYTYPGW